MKPAVRKAQRGHAMIELAFAAMVMASCLGGTVEFGYTFLVYDQLVSAVGNGGRYAAMRTYRAASPQDIEKGRAAIRNLVVYGNSQPDRGAVPVAPGLATENVKVDWVKDEKGVPSAVDVSIVNYQVHAVFGSFTFTGRPSAEFPFVGRYAPGESER
jgi:Flp pilus assembly protein TadG